MYNRVAVIGLGYVGLPLAVEIGKRYTTVGYDISTDRLRELSSGVDSTNEVSQEDLAASTHLKFTSDKSDLKGCDLFIITVPTPVDSAKKPNLKPLREASKTVGSVMSKGAVVVYESTVYPGCTEEICVPILSKYSGLEYNSGFYCGYSPERINPGDQTHRLTNIVKVVSGSTPEVAEDVNEFYSTFISAGTHLAPSIKVAEASKVIENAQRDINIAFVNELAIIFERLDIDTEEVLIAAGTKWNFLPFRPGLVGGHCIGVDPYYLTYKAEELGYTPQVILAGRSINDNMGAYIARKAIKEALRKKINVVGARSLILGATFKENCPDIRNSKVFDIVSELNDHNLEVDVFDPLANPEEIINEYGVETVSAPTGHYNLIILAVAHNVFKDFDIQTLRASNSVVIDVKSFYPKCSVDYRL